MVHDAFINGLLSHVIRQRLLENRELDLATAFEQSRTLDLAQKNSEAYDLGKVLASSVSDEASEVHSQNPEVTGSSRKLFLLRLFVPRPKGMSCERKRLPLV